MCHPPGRAQRDLAEMAGLPVTDQDMDNFRDIWKLYDPAGVDY
jgi:hypothetical protein